MQSVYWLSSDYLLDSYEPPFGFASALVPSVSSSSSSSMSGTGKLSIAATPVN